MHCISHFRFIMLQNFILPMAMFRLLDHNWPPIDVKKISLSLSLSHTHTQYCNVDNEWLCIFFTQL